MRARRPEGSRAMDEKDDGFMFGDDEEDAPTWHELWDMNKMSIYGSIAGTVIVLVVFFLLHALGVI